MKPTLLFIAFVLASLAMSAQEELAVEDIQNSGCLNQTRGGDAEPVQTIVLQKEGSVLSVQLLNYTENCGTTDFHVTSTLSGGSNSGPCSLNVNVEPVIPQGYWCECPFNVSFTVRDLEANRFILSCWWYEGGVELTNGEPLILKNQDNFSYLPFVKEGKRWNVFRSDFDTGCHLEQYMLGNEGIVKDGKTYMKMYRSEDGKDVVYDTGLFREEDRKVYIFDAERQEEYLMFDYSLKAGDTYETYSNDEQRMVTYKILSVSDYQEGPEVIRYDYDEKADSLITHRRYLRKWTVCRTDNESSQKSWIESAGSLEGPLGNLRDVVLPDMCWDYLGYVDDNYGSIYLPFSFHDTWNRQVYGCDLPTGTSDNWEDFHHQLTYELEGDRLHIYGEVFTNCGPNDYAYFFEKPTDDPLVHKIEFEIQEVEPTKDCAALHATDFYVSGFDPNLNYIVVDDQGVEHPVINKASQIAYRPMIEEGKVWKIGDVTSGNPAQCVDYFYFDGDTIIDGRICKQMMCQRYVNPDYPYYNNTLSYVGAWYEEDRKVYFCDATSNQFRLKYDFSLDGNDTIQIDNNPYLYVIGPRQTGGINGFKGVYRKVSQLADGERIYRCAPWLEGVGVIYDSPIFNIFNVALGDPATGLMSCTVGDEVIYLVEGWEDGATPAEARKRIDFTHTIKTRPQAPRKEMGAQASSPAEAEQSLYGEYNNLQLDINLNPLADAYQVSITDETGKAVYEKNVNAASIVGLNIDISAYPAGRYTVIVENSSESFTGVFDTLTTGISDAERLNRNEEINNNDIYNLQGQRIRSLQRGLNIVNGQKIYVE